ncbi:hypothetical protein VR45_20835 [Streptomyces sp. NRRL S-495]|nr:hypothetical protein VR45_20835 [Streptomyces sp. NRRL S-495]
MTERSASRAPAVEAGALVEEQRGTGVEGGYGGHLVGGEFEVEERTATSGGSQSIGSLSAFGRFDLAVTATRVSRLPWPLA